MKQSDHSYMVGGLVALMIHMMIQFSPKSLVFAESQKKTWEKGVGYQEDRFDQPELRGENRIKMASSAITLGERQIIVLRADLENIWGSYYFAASNHTESVQRLSLSMPLPKQATDFRPQDGLVNEDIQLDHRGALLIDKWIQPGLTLFSVGFKIPVTRFGPEILTLVMTWPIEELSVAVDQNSDLSLHSATMRQGLAKMLDPKQFRGIKQIRLKTGQKVIVTVQGVPKDRNILFLVAVVVGCLFAAFLCLYLVITRQGAHSIDKDASPSSTHGLVFH